MLFAHFSKLVGAVGCSLILGACSAAPPASAGSFEGVIAGSGETGIMNLSIDDTPDPETGSLPAFGHMETAAANPYVSTVTGALEEPSPSLSAHADGGGYAFEGTSSGDLLVGTYRRYSAVDGAFALINTSQGPITRLCGSMSGARGGTIALAMASSGMAVAAMFLASGKAVVLQGSSDGVSASLQGDSGHLSGSIHDGKATGEWAIGADVGTWTATPCVP
ncbi:MAG: hypothetical protein HY898_12200 [Deltaproteobacteria bacterium]|nr:hypothetical protein [Deltaproteobacteria bacterium]